MITTPSVALRAALMRASAVVAMCTLIDCGFITDVNAATDTCREDGGTAICVGPEVGPYRYQVGSFLSSGVGQGASEGAAIAEFEKNAIDWYKTCTFGTTDNAPPWHGVPAGAGGGHFQHGDYGDALTGGVEQFWSIDWILRTEWQQLRAPLRYDGTDGATTSPPCQRHWFGGAYIARVRDVDCPDRYNRDPATATYCYRLATVADPRKNLGGQCTAPLLKNPVNAATGNKFQVETDYVGQGAMPLTFVRSYNSQLWDRSYSPTTPNVIAGFWSRLGPNWRSSYDRFISLSDSDRFPTVYAYRPDGRTLHFKRVNDEFAPDADIADRLVRLTDGSGGLTGWQYTVADTEETEIYDAAGKLTAIANRSGLTHTLAYDANGRLSTVTDAFGRTLILVYDTNGRLGSLTDPAGGNYIYAYNDVGNVSSVTSPDQKVRTYHYNEPEHTGGANLPYALTGITDENGERFSIYTYDGQGRAVSSEHAGGADKITLSYGTNSTTVKDAVGTTRTYAFQTILGVAKNTSLSQPCSTCGGAAAAATAYDANGNVASRKDFNGNLTCDAYDLSRNLETVRGEGLKSGACPANLTAWTPDPKTVERKITTEWHPTWRLPTRVAEPKRITTYVYNGDGVNCALASATVGEHPIGVLCSKTEQATSDASGAFGLGATPVGSPRVSTYTYNEFGQVLTFDGPRTDIADLTTYQYWPLDATCVASLPGASETACRGQLKQVTNAAGHPTTFDEYNAHGQPLKVVDPNEVVTVLGYDARLRLTSRTVGSQSTHFQYDGVGQLDLLTLPDTSVLDYDYDDAHRLTDLRDSLRNHIQYTLDGMGNRRVEQVFDPSEARKAEHSRDYDPLNRLFHDFGGTNPASQVTEYGYDPQGNLRTRDGPLTPAQQR